VIGTLDHFTRDSQDNFGKYFHGHIFVNTPGGQYEGAVDVSVPDGYKIHYKVMRGLSTTLFATVSNMPDGFHLLARSSTSGALDYVRSALLNPFPSVLTRLASSNRFLLNLSANMNMRISSLIESWLSIRRGRWVQSNGNNALDAMETAITGCTRIFVFGEKFNTGLGVHDVHMNQGDPAGSQWFAANGIWQDGGTIALRSDGTLVAFLTKFSNQTMNTDNNGNPI
jgi:hypothetical protein